MEEEWGDLSEVLERLGTEKVAQLLSLESRADGWEDLGVKDDVHSFRTHYANGYLLKATCTMPFPPQVVYDLVKDYTRKKEWSLTLKQCQILQHFSDHTRLVYEEYQTPWPISNRDILVGNYLQETSDYKLSVFYSVEHPSVPPNRSLVRAHCDVGGFVVREDGASSRVTFVLCNDPRGSIPQAIVNTVQKKQAGSLSRIRDFLARSS